MASPNLYNPADPKATRIRSFSDTPNSKPSLSPSPLFQEPAGTSKDDLTVGPTTPKRPIFLGHGLSLQMPPLGNPGSSLTASIPLSPKLDPSPASMLPRRSRGLDYTRACTNLHHSTLAESSPDASPTISGRGIQIPQRRSTGITIMESPSNLSNSLWTSISNIASDRPVLSSSVSSVNMFESDSDSSSSSQEDLMERDNEDAIMNTPQSSKLAGAFLGGQINSPGGDWRGVQSSPAASSLLSFQQRARLRKTRSRRGPSNIKLTKRNSQGPLSPPLMKSIENISGGYFNQNFTQQQAQSRRESLSLGTDHLHLSDSEDGEVRASGNSMYQSSSSSTPGVDGPRGVVRRIVTRRGNLLPKTKNFARIRAALLEESAPIDSEAKREAEVIHQVRESDPTLPLKTSTKAATQPLSHDVLDSPPMEDIIQKDRSCGSAIPPQLLTFGQHAERHSAGLGFWKTFDERYRTPPPPLPARESSSGMSDEMMDTPPSSIGGGVALDMNPEKDSGPSGSRSRSSTPIPSTTQIAPPGAELVRRVNNKRRRDDAFDPASLKRRAVSPGMSLQSSPVLPQSPVMSSEKAWGQPPSKSHGPADRSNSGGSVNGAKRVGLQGMVATNDGLMNMSIE